MWERGLKLASVVIVRPNNEVAPHVGAWIETVLRVRVSSFVSRSPCGSVD